MRPRRAPSAAARLARRAAARGRAGRAGGARPLPALLARDRPAGDRCARRSCRCRRSRCPVALWESRAPAPPRAPATGPSSSTRSARAARSSGSEPALDRVALYFREDAAALGAGRRHARRPRARCTTGSAARSRRGALFWLDLLEETGASPDEALPGSLGSRLGGRGDERRLDAAARRPPPRRAQARAAPAALLPLARRRRRRRRRAAGRSPARLFAGRAGAAGARRAAARAAGHRHPRRRPRRGDSRRLRRRLRGAARARDARALPPRLLRRGARRRPVRARRRGRAAPRAARARERSRAPLVLAAADPAQPYGAALAVAEARRARAPRGSRAPTSSLLGGEAVLYVERGGRSLVPLRDPDESWLRPALAALVAHVRAGGAERLAVERFDGEPVTESDVDAPPRRGRVPRRPAARRAAAVSACPRATPSTAPRPGYSRSSASSSSVEAPHPRARAGQIAERLDGRRLEAVEAIGKNLVLRFEGGVVLRSHLRMSGPLDAARPAARAERGRPWLILRGAELEGVLWGGPVLELHTRALAAARPRHPRLAARASSAMLARLAGRRDAPVRRDPARPEPRRRDRQHVDGGDALAGAALALAVVSREVPEPRAAARSRDGGRADAGRGRRRSRAARAGLRPRRPAVPALRTRIRSRGQGDANRTAYWCPACQPGEPRRRPGALLG